MEEVLEVTINAFNQVDFTPTMHVETLNFQDEVATHYSVEFTRMEGQIHVAQTVDDGMIYRHQFDSSNG